jgi:hypothetical protein
MYKRERSAFYSWLMAWVHSHRKEQKIRVPWNTVQAAWLEGRKRLKAELKKREGKK